MGSRHTDGATWQDPLLLHGPLRVSEELLPESLVLEALLYQPSLHLRPARSFAHACLPFRSLDRSRFLRVVLVARREGASIPCPQRRAIEGLGTRRTSENAVNRDCLKSLYEHRKGTPRGHDEGRQGAFVAVFDTQHRHSRRCLAFFRQSQHEVRRINLLRSWVNRTRKKADIASG
jgi:hypothetical protein